MGYVAVQGGITAIENSQKLNRYLRLRGTSVPLSVTQIMEQMGPLVDRVMSEGGLYSPFHAALALKQASGDPLEASFLVRAYRSTLRRMADSLPDPHGRDADPEAHLQRLQDHSRRPGAGVHVRLRAEDPRLLPGGRDGGDAARRDPRVRGAAGATAHGRETCAARSRSSFARSSTCFASRASLLRDPPPSPG